LIDAYLELPILLRHLVGKVCSMAGACWGALQVLNCQHTELVEIITVGVGSNEVANIGPVLTGQRIPGFLIAVPVALRLQHFGTDAKRYGFPDKVEGKLHLTSKVGSSECTRDDEALIKSMPLRRESPSRTHGCMDDKRKQVARDLLDTVIQRPFCRWHGSRTLPLLLTTLTCRAGGKRSPKTLKAPSRSCVPPRAFEVAGDGWHLRAVSGGSNAW